MGGVSVKIPYSPQEKFAKKKPGQKTKILRWRREISVKRNRSPLAKVLGQPKFGPPEAGVFFLVLGSSKGNGLPKLVLGKIPFFLNVLGKCFPLFPLFLSVFFETAWEKNSAQRKNPSFYFFPSKRFRKPPNKKSPLKALGTKKKKKTMGFFFFFSPPSFPSRYLGFSGKKNPFHKFPGCSGPSRLEGIDHPGFYSPPQNNFLIPLSGMGEKASTLREFFVFGIVNWTWEVFFNARVFLKSF